MSDINAAFDKAAEGLVKEQAPQGQAIAQTPAVAKPQSSDKANEAQKAPVAPETKVEDKDKREWDGKPETLTNELKQDPKAIQRAYSKKAMALADAEKKLKEFQDIKADELAAYRQWKQQQEMERQQQLVQQPPAPTQLTAEQYEYLKNNPEAFQQYMNSVVQQQIQAAAQQLLPQIQQVQYEQNVNKWEQTIADFGEVHPDMWEMHESGLFKPILEETVKAGGTLDDAYNRSAQIWNAMKAKAEAAAQAGVRQKMDASSIPNSPTGQDDTIYADNPKDALNKAFDLAYSKKEFVAKDATVSPRGRVRIRK